MDAKTTKLKKQIKSGFYALLLLILVYAVLQAMFKEWLVEDLKQFGVQDFHFYTLNQMDACKEICERVKSLS